MFKYFKSFVTILILATISTSCSTLREVDLTKVKLGMSKAEVETALKKRPDKVVAAKHLTDPESIIEILQFSQDQAIIYHLYFLNDRLEEWHEVRPNERTPIL